MRIFLILILLVASIKTVNSQTTKRTIIDKESQLPVAYATVKVLHAKKGTIASDKGEFYLDINLTDSVLFSCVGYEQKILKGSEIAATIYLNRKIKTLSEITIKPVKVFQKLVLGNRDKLRADIRWGPSMGENKDELAQKIDIPDSSLIYKIRVIHIPVEKFTCWGPLYLTIYAEDSLTGFPGEELYGNLIKVNSKKIDNGILKIDLTREDILINHRKDFFIGIKWLDNEETERCVSTIQLSKYSTQKTFTRTLTSSNYNWFPFGEFKSLDGIPFNANTFFSVEVDEMK